MYYPERYRPLALVRLDERGQPIDWPKTYAYVPPGFYRIGPFDFGNGDVHGFYWPLGRNKEEPLVCETYHDGAWLEPHASGLEGCVRLKWADGFRDARSHNYEEARHLAEQLALSLGPPLFRQEYQAPPLADLLQADPSSPAVLVRAAKERLAQNELEQARRYLTRALEVLPEFTDARWLLAGLHRRNRQGPEAAEEMLHVLRCPLCFGGDRGQCLRWLQRARDADAPRGDDDPLWRRRHDLTFKTGVAYNDDYLIYDEAMAAYLEQGRFFEAVTLRLTYGQLMLRETHPFQERYGFTWEGHSQRLRDDLLRAGWRERAEVVAAVSGR